ncbi:unnamed protein product, partial [Vitis vinifera]
MGGDKNFYELKHLSDNDCWELFKKHAFENRNTNEHPDLALIGREIVKKCGGLPLAAKALGGLLRHEHREDKWNIILASKIWNLPGDKCGILPALRLSYNHLPSHLKRCFAYCALFPQDYEFKKEELILLWMAEGLIQQSNEDEKMEDLGDDYFCELLSRSFFQSSNSNKSRFVMHDLINDLAKSIAGDTCLHLDDGLWNDLQRSVPESTRHSSFIRHLRVLSLAHYMISEIPDSFGKLKHLRYLDLSYTSIKWLPDSIGNLFYLQTLKLSCCEELIRLPISIGNLINLRHLDVAGAIRLQEMPVQIGKLKDLRILSNFIVDKNNGLTIKELTGMSHLRRQLCISKLENVVNIQDARDADLKLKRNLESLIMQWSSELDGSGNERNQMDVLDSLQPCLNLNKLCIQLYGGPEFPRWIGDALFSKMVDLSLIDCRKCTSLPCLGQLPSLKQLRIQGMVGVKKVGAEFYGETRVSAGKFFPSLESLHFNSMSEWEHWEDWSSSTESLFPCLHELTIEDCPKLIMKLPTYLPSLTELSSLAISGCAKLERLPNGWQSLTCLEELTIRDCPKLASFPDVGFPPKLRSLTVGNCKGIKSLPDGMMLKMRNDTTDSNNSCVLESLEIEQCPSLICFPKGQLPTTLKSLRILACENLKDSQ